MVVVLGAGITGLTVARELHRRGTPFKLFEAADRVGGNIGTRQIGAYRVEIGPNSLRLDDALHDFLDSISLLDQLKYASPEAKKRYVLRDGKYVALPAGPPDFLRGGVFTWRTKARILAELLFPKHQPLPKELTLDAFVRGRFGDELADYAVQPFIGGTFAGDAKKIRLGDAFPELAETINRHGSLLRGMRARAKTQQHTGIVSLAGGLQSLVDRLASPLEAHIHCGDSAVRISAVDRAWQINFASGETVRTEKLVAALPAHILSSLLADAQPPLASALGNISYPPVTVVHTAYSRASLPRNWSGFGALHNAIEPSETLGTIFSSSVFPGCCPADEVMFATFLGGAMAPDRAGADDEAIAAAVAQDHLRFLQIKAEPTFQYIQRWPRAIPQYDARRAEAMVQLAKNEREGLLLGGNWRDGISVGTCITSGQRLAAKILA